MNGPSRLPTWLQENVTHASFGDLLAPNCCDDEVCRRNITSFLSLQFQQPKTFLASQQATKNIIWCLTCLLRFESRPDLQKLLKGFSRHPDIEVAQFAAISLQSSRYSQNNLAGTLESDIVGSLKRYLRGESN